MKNKKFDCVKLQHDSAEKVYELTRNMTIAEEIAYWQRRSEELRQLCRIREMKRKSPESVCSEISFRQAEAA